MTEAAALDWAAAQRRAPRPARLAAAVALHGAVLALLILTTARVRVDLAAPARAMRWVEVTLAPVPAPARPAVATPSPGRVARTPAPAVDARRAPPPMTALAADRPGTHAITAPASAPVLASAAPPPASAASAARIDFLAQPGTRDAIRAVARGATLADTAAAAAAVPRDSAMDPRNPDDSPRHLAESRSANVRLAEHVRGALKPDCLKQAAGAGFFAAPVLVVTEAAGQCSN